jgi:cyclomaltodextrinase / maltogenic alpha-amylase / neopullulanase
VKAPDSASTESDGAAALKPGRYRHFKGGEYLVQGIATHSETGEQLVVYTPLYGAGGLWVRPLAMFLETVHHEGAEQTRFRLIE